LKYASHAAAWVVLAMMGAAPPLARAADEPAPAYGGGDQDLWVTAASFVSQSGQDTLTNRGGQYFSPIGSGNGQFGAPVPMEAGARITRFECDFFDDGPFQVAAALLRNEGTGTAPTSDTVLAEVSSTGPGYQVAGQGLAHTVQTRQGALRIFYWIQLQMQAGDPSTMFRGCRVVWHRQVSPAPALATFADVPAGHPQFRFVEALAAAGISGGCGAGNFCPDAPLTRGQMAVFLATALGLHFPF
jgi:S-layer family protein